MAPLKPPFSTVVTDLAEDIPASAYDDDKSAHATGETDKLGKDGVNVSVLSTSDHDVDNTAEYAEFLRLNEKFSTEEGKKQWAKTLWKMDLRILPPYVMTYLLAFLDRGNVGNAKVAGMLKDVPMSDTLYTTGLAAFFMLYIICEIPSQIMLKKFGPRIWISFLVIACGIVMACGGAIQNAPGFIVMRLMLGLAESGLMPGINFILATWYTREELAKRVAIFFGSASIAGAFSGILAFGITKLGGRHGIEGWRRVFSDLGWIFIIEGAITAGFGLLCPIIIITNASTAGKWLSEDERRFLLLRQKYTVEGGAIARSTSNKGRLMKEVFTSWHIWPQAIIYFTHSMTGYSTAFTLPVIVKALQFSTYESFLIPVPIYVGACICSFINSYLSDRRKSRFLHLVIPFGAGIFGFALTMAAEGKRNLVGLSMTGMIIFIFSIYAAVPPSIAWIAASFPEPHKHVALGTAISFGSAGGLVGSFIYKADESPNYPTGYGVSIGMSGLAIVCCIVLKIGYERSNKKKDQLTEEQIESQWTSDAIAEAGDKSPYFRYWS